MNNANITSPRTQIKWMCRDIFITIDKVVINQDFNVLSEKLCNSSFGYKCDGKFRTKKWINENSFNVLGLIDF